MGRLIGADGNTDSGAQHTGADITDVPGARDLWSGVMTTVQGEIAPNEFNKWLEPIRFVAEVNDAIVIAAQDQFTLDRVNSEYARKLQLAWQAADPKARRLKIQLWSRISADIRDIAGDPWAQPAVEQTAEEETAPTVSATAIGSMSFDTLVTGPSNARAVGLGKRVASGEPIPAGVIVVYGQPGTGKTHILKAIESAAAAKNDARRIAYLSAEEFMTRFVDGARSGDTAQLQAFVKQNDLLMIDDLHWIAGKQKTDKAFFGALRAVTSMGGHVIITADAAPGDMVGLSRELSAEIRGAAAVEVSLPDDDMRREIVRRHAALIELSTPNFILTETMIDRIISTIRGPGRELCGVLYSLQLETGYGEFTPTLDMLDTVIRRIAGEPRTPSLDDIKRACMDLFNVSRNDIESASKVRTICHPRQVAMYLSRVMTDKSYPQIAQAYKKKDHTTVLHAYRKITKALKNADPDMMAEIDRAKHRIFERMSGMDTAN